MNYNYKIYTDGSSKRVTDNWISGISFVIVDSEDNKLFSLGRAVPECTISRAEILATVEGLDYLDENFSLTDNKIVVYSDSRYVVDSYNVWMENWKRANWINGWARSYRLHHDLFKRLYDYKHREDCTVHFVHVPAHSDIKYNELADQLAKEARANLEI